MRLLDFLVEDKSRFINKNKYLNKPEKDKLIAFFKMNRQAEKAVDWNKSQEMDYEDFEKVMLKFKSGRQAVVKHRPISGLKEKEDYIKLKLKRKDYLAYAVMTYKGSQAIASSKVGPCRGKWCVAHSDSANYWNEYAVRGGSMFVYVMNADAKWAVQIPEFGSHTVWDAEDRSGANIPGFDVKKELLTPQLKKLYDEIRQRYKSEANFEEAEEAYDYLVRQLDDMQSEYEGAREWFWDETSRIKRETIEEVREEIEELEEEYQTFEGILKKARERRELKTKTLKPLPGVKMTYGQDIGKITKKMRTVKDNIDELEDAIEAIEEIEYYEMDSTDPPNGVKWSDDPPSEDYIYDHIYGVDIQSDRFQAYFDFAEANGADVDFDGLQQDMWEFTHEEGYSATEFLDSLDLYAPSSYNN